MKFEQALISAKIVKRYKRFLADVVLANGEEVTVHVPNTGSMTNCWEKDWPVLISKSNNPKRKLPYTLEMTHNGSTYIGVNTSLTNKIVAEAIANETITEVQNYSHIKPEKVYNKSRIDFYLSGHKDTPDAYLEVKNVTLNHGDTAIFPDSVSTRGQKHLKELMQIKQEGHRAIMLFVVNREDVTQFSPAKKIDPVYAQLLTEAKSMGVEILAYQSTLTNKEISLNKKVEVCL